jgi:hypothetical protein
MSHDIEAIIFCEDLDMELAVVLLKGKLRNE